MTGRAPWTEDLDAFLRAHCGQMSTSKIADDLNSQFGTAFTRNAVIGRMHRLGMQTRVKPAPAKPPVATKVMRRAAPSAKGNGYSADGAKAAGVLTRIKQLKAGARPVSDKFKPRSADGVSRELTLIELGDGDCRWPDERTNARGQHTFCGAAAVVGCPYCHAHMALAWGIGTASERNADKTLLEASQ